MGLRAWNVAVVVAALGVWLSTGTQKAQPVLASGHDVGTVSALEAEVAAHPNDAADVRMLAQAYMDHHASGMAVSLIESSPDAVRADPRVDHLYARALVDQGRNQEALAAERRVLADCSAVVTPGGDAHGCDMTLLASATRRAEILQELVNLGVEDSQAQPEEAALAYYAATREARIATK
jgi:hypothetical protein